MPTAPPRSERPDMAAYGVTDDPEGLLPFTWAEERLAATRNFWFVTVAANGRPHAMPLWGVWRPEVQRFGFGCAPTARKVRNLEANPRVVVTTENTIECVSIEGVAQPLAGEELDATATAWAAKYHDGTQTLDEMVGFFRESAAYEVVPERAFGIIETPDQFGSAATRWVWS